MTEQPFYFLPVNKPPHKTSHDVVGAVRRLLPRGTKIGHGGTLDPFATGVLVLGIGKATRFFDLLHELPKAYVGEIELGKTTDTLDPTGAFLDQEPVPEVTKELLSSLSDQFKGQIEQVPPSFSAKKVDGQRAYKLARKNQEVTLKASHVTLHHLKLERLDDCQLRLEVVCSKGTYIRSLARDIAKEIGTCGYLTSLCRTQVGSIGLGQCAELQDLSSENLQDFSLSVAETLQIPTLDLPPEADAFLFQGRPWPALKAYPPEFIATSSAVGPERRYFCRMESGNVICRFRCF